MITTLPRGHPRARDHGDGQRPGDRRRRRAAGARGHGRRRGARAAGLARPRVAPAQRAPARAARAALAWLGEHLGDFDGSGIIYTLTVAATQEVAEHLRSKGHAVAAYSGQTEAAERLSLEQDLLAGRLKALVATSALGMGFDARLGFVVNLGAPSSPVAYYQQVGRAGRGTDHASVVLLPAQEDRDIWRYFASLAFPPEQHVRTALRVLAENDAAMSTAALETYVDLSRTRLETMLKVLDVDGAVDRVRGGWTATGEDWVYDQDRYDRVAAARRDEQAAMLAYIATDGCRMRFLREQLDDPGAVDCGRCDNCTGAGLSTELSGAAVAEAEERLRRPGVTLAPRKMWPTALANLGVDLKGKIAEGAEEGRAVGRLTDLGHGQLLRALFRPETEDGPVPRSLVDAVLEVRRLAPRLARTAHRGGVRRVGAPSPADPRLRRGDRALPQAAARRSLGGRRSRGPAGRGAANSAQRVAAVGRRFSLTPRAARRAPRRGPRAAPRRPRGHRLDDDPRRPGAARGRRVRRTPPGAGRRVLTGIDPGSAVGQVTATIGP